MRLTKQQVETYIREDLDSKPRHDCDYLASAINEIADASGHPSYELMELLLFNKPMESAVTHSYDFHTRYGRVLIEAMTDAYNLLNDE